MGRAPCCDKSSVKKGHWSPEEDKQLKEYIEKHGTGGNWITLPHKSGLNRCGKSCRLRWLNYLKPNIKHGCFSDDEDRIIANLYASIGSRWSVIASHLPGRTDNDIKNYWNTKLKKKFSGMIRPHPKRIKRVNRHHHDQQQQQQQEYSYGFPSSSDSSDPLLLSSPMAAYLLSSLTHGNAAGTGNPVQHLPAAPVQYSSFNPMESWGGDQDASSCLGLETFFYGGGGDGAAADAALMELNLEEYADHLIPSPNAGYVSTAGWISEDGEYGDAALMREAAARAMLDPEEQRAQNMSSAIRSWRGCSYDSIAHVSSSALW